MAELVETFCPWCNANLRPKAVFCHKCGHTLPQAGQTQELQAAVLEDSSVMTETPVSTEEKAAETAAENLNGTAIETAADSDAPVKNDKPVPAKRRTKRYASRTEYVWEESEAPTLRIVLFSILALGIVFLMLWMSKLLR